MCDPELKEMRLRPCRLRACLGRIESPREYRAVWLVAEEDAGFLKNCSGLLVKGAAVNVLDEKQVKERRDRIAYRSSWVRA